MPERHTAAAPDCARDVRRRIGDERHIDDPRLRACDLAVAALAARQHAMVSTAQLHAAGLSAHAIRLRTRAGRLHPMHRGVHAVGHLALPPLAHESAALLACGAGAVLSHRSAAAIWGLADRDEHVVDVTVPRRRRHRAGIRVHSGALEPREVRICEGLRATTPLRTLADLAQVVGEAELERAVSEALFRRLVTEAQVRDAVPRARALLDTGGAGSRHEAERILLRLIRRAGLPQPERNARVHGFEADFWWPGPRLDLELDGFDGHGHRVAFERDRRRDLALKARGVDTVRVTWRMLTQRSEQLLATLGAALLDETSHARGRGAPR